MSSDALALVPYHSSTTTTPSTNTWRTSTSLLPSRLFTAQTGHALATELLYRLLFDILNRVLASLHRFAATRLDSLGKFVERKFGERWEAQSETRALGEGRGRITQEVGRAAARRGFGSSEVAGGVGVVCPMTGEGTMGAGMGGPPGWVGQVLRGIHEGWLEERDFWGHPFGN
ncbi:hypothetical protein BU23DRAFT_115105 [Bimuria novae-zelandiae CBS 107.79]|uniref:Uncharacterized protein n=1 Tax=Bimuria novae-zelandiae CBS 107.79 TaxID=1447943 RepID=A0A6A5VB15_9PLEO|nr:hypothetical protein BU23DRAFT_115105 [Bimuria novae-zelandiae CBS 107.79]